MSGQVNNQNNNNPNFKSSVSGNTIVTKEKTRFKYVCFDKKFKNL